MGLDMYAHAYRFAAPSMLEDFPRFGSGEIAAERTNCTIDGPKEGASEFAYWRKHANLQGWMENLARELGFDEESFNCVWLRLTPQDLDRLEADMEKGLETATGFFWGESTPEKDAYTLQFIKSARYAMKKGVTIFYDSWW
jgi:hypothetical protein